MTEWHGMKHDEVQHASATIPANPNLRQSMDATTYARVHFSGNYGANFCGQFQEFDRFNITADEAHQIA